MNSLERMIGIIDLFDGPAKNLSFAELHERLGYSRSTLYRYLKTLTDAELLTSWPHIGFTLGPRFTELDYQMRHQDPLILAGKPVMRELVDDVPGIALLCRRYRGKVLCVHQETSTDAIQSTYERGKTQPLLSGAASQIILAFLPRTAISKVYDQHVQQFSEAELGNDLTEVRRSLREIRKRGWDVTEGRLTPGVIGIAAPVFGEADVILGSFSITIPKKSRNRPSISAITERVVLMAQKVTKAIQSS